MLHLADLILMRTCSSLFTRNVRKCSLIMVYSVHLTKTNRFINSTFPSAIRLLNEHVNDSTSNIYIFLKLNAVISH